MNDIHPSLERITDYVHGELSTHDDAAVHEHLATCRICAEAHDAEVRLVEVLRAHARAEELEMPPGLATAILANALAEPAPSWRQRLSASLRPALAIPLAAAIVLAVYFGFAGRHDATGTTVDPVEYLENHAALAATMPFDENAVTAMELTSETSGDGQPAP